MCYRIENRRLTWMSEWLNAANNVVNTTASKLYITSFKKVTFSDFTESDSIRFLNAEVRSLRQHLSYLSFIKKTADQWLFW